MPLSLSLKPFTVTTGKAMLLNGSIGTVTGMGGLDDTDVEIGVKWYGGNLSRSGVAVSPSLDQAQNFMSWFSLADYTSGKVAFVANGSSTPSFSFWVREVGSASLPEGNSEGIAPQIVYKHVNQAPTLSFDLGSLQEGQLKTVTVDMIRLSDVDTPDDQFGEITLKVAKVTGGKFMLNGQAATSFTYADVLHGIVSFQHDGNNASPVISLQALDAALKPATSSAINAALNFSNVTDAPLISIVKPIQIKLGFKAEKWGYDKATDLTYPISPDMVIAGRTSLASSLKITSEDSPLSSLSFTATPIGCRLVYLNPLTKTYDNWQGSFTAADLPKLFVQMDDYTSGGLITLSDNSGPIATISVYTNNPWPYDPDGENDELRTNLAPTISSAQIQNLVPGSSLFLDAESFSVTDFEKITEYIVVWDSNGAHLKPKPNPATSEISPNSGTILTVTALKGCAFKVNGSVSTNFSLAELKAGVVEIIHLGLPGVNPSFSISAKDPQGLSSKPLAVDVNAQIGLAVKAPLAITEGADLKLSPANLLISASKAQLATDFQIDVVNVEHGQVGQINPLTKVFTAVESFLYADLKAGKIIFRHNGDDTIPSLKLAVAGEESWIPFTFKGVDDAPVLALNALAINSGDTILLNPKVIAVASDEELPQSLWESMMVSIKTNNGLVFKIGGVEVKAFSILDVDNDLVSVTRSASGPASAILALTDATGKVSALQTLGSVARASSNDFAPEIQLGNLAIAEGQTITLSTAHINATDADANTPDYEISFYTTAEHGAFLKAGQHTDNFTLADLKAGRVAFRHDGSSLAPTLSLQVSDADWAGHSSDFAGLPITFTLVDSAPIVYGGINII